MHKLRISTKAICNFILFVYLCIPFFNSAISRIIPINGIRGNAVYLSLIPILMLYILVCVSRKQLVVYEFWILYVAICAFFALTLLFHPEYEYWFMRTDYGVWNYVLRPDNGIFIYLFLRLVNDPKQILKVLRVSGWVIYLYYSISIISAMRRGYWIDLSNRGYEIHLSYNLTLGYNVLLYVLTFFYCAIVEKKKSDWISAFFGVGIILIGGSRGPFLDIAIFFAILAILRTTNKGDRVKIIVGIILLLVVAVVLFPYLILAANALLSRFNMKSRFITSILNGTIVDDNRRIMIWGAALDMIKKNPFGYGAMGSRHVIANYIYVAHPHQLFLEILIDFGVFAGAVLIVWMVFHSIRLFRYNGFDEWKGIFLIFFSRSCQLLVSLTFWHSIALWGVLAVGVCMNQAIKRGKKNVEQ